MFTFGPHTSTVVQQQQQQPYPYPYPRPLVFSPGPQRFGSPGGARHARGKSANSLPRYRTETDSQLITVLTSMSQRLREAQSQPRNPNKRFGSSPEAEADITKVFRRLRRCQRWATKQKQSLDTESLSVEPPKEKDETPQKKTHISALSMEFNPSTQKGMESVCGSSNTSVLDMFYTNDKVDGAPESRRPRTRMRRASLIRGIALISMTQPRRRRLTLRLTRRMSMASTSL